MQQTRPPEFAHSWTKITATTLRRLGEASRRLIRLWFEMHYFAHLVVCWIGRIQPSDPLLPTFYVVKESPVSRTTTVADPVKVGGGQDFQSGWRGVVFDAIELAQIIAITDLCDNLTCFRAFLVKKVQTNEVGWLMVFGFGHELRHSMCWSCLAAYWSCLSAQVYIRYT